MTVGKLSQTTEQVTENILCSVAKLASSVAGGWNNVRSVHVRAQDTPSIPVYVSFGMICNIQWILVSIGTFTWSVRFTRDDVRFCSCFQKSHLLLLHVYLMLYNLCLRKQILFCSLHSTASVHTHAPALHHTVNVPAVSMVAFYAVIRKIFGMFNPLTPTVATCVQL